MEGEIYNEFASKMVVAPMVSKDPNFVDQQRALYEPVHSTRVSYNTITIETCAEVMQTIADENMVAYIGSSTLFAGPTLLVSGRNNHEANPSTSIVDLTSINSRIWKTDGGRQT